MAPSGTPPRDPRRPADWWRLVAARRQAVEAQLALGLAHDLNNLLARIIGAAELVQDGLDPGSDAAADLELIMATAEAGAVITHRMLAAAAGDDDLRAFDLTDMVEAFRAEIPDLVRDAGAPEPAPLMVAADELLVAVATGAALEAARERGGSGLSLGASAGPGPGEAMVTVRGAAGGERPESGLDFVRAVARRWGGRAEAADPADPALIVRLVLPSAGVSEASATL